MEIQRVQETVHTLRQKPLHVRERIALGASLGVTLVVALGWIAASAVNGTFSLVPQSLAQAGSAGASVAQQAGAQGSNVNSLLGAAGAALGATETPATVTVVDTQVHSTLDSNSANDTNQTVLHF